MRRIIHLSDLHFGWDEQPLVDTLCRLVTELHPDLTVLSGDFTEHATRSEFLQARKFLDGLPKPIMTVPGNHDLPFYNFPLRVLQGLRLYREFVTNDLCPFYRDDEMAVMGVNTARVWPIRNGSINRQQVADIKQKLCDLPQGVIRILVTHHPFDLPESFDPRYLVHHGAKALEELACCLDLLLAGHMHIGASGRVADRFQTPNGSLVFSQAGTAISKRYKGERNSFNLVEVGSGKIQVEKYSWDADQSAFQAKPTSSLNFAV